MARTLLLIGTMRSDLRFRRAALPLMLVAVFATDAPAQRPVNRLAGTLEQFHERVTSYLKLRKEVESKVGSVPETKEPAVITQRQHRLGEAIRDARAEAKPGDIFTPPIAGVFRQLIARDLAGRRPVDRHAFVVEQPDVTVRVNDFYPTTVPLASVPPRLLQALPTLPDGLEYRFVGHTLILRDVDPNLVVDVLPRAIPARYRKH